MQICILIHKTENFSRLCIACLLKLNSCHRSQTSLAQNISLIWHLEYFKIMNKSTFCTNKDLNSFIERVFDHQVVKTAKKVNLWKKKSVSIVLRWALDFFLLFFLSYFYFLVFFLFYAVLLCFMGSTFCLCIHIALLNRQTHRSQDISKYALFTGFHVLLFIVQSEQIHVLIRFRGNKFF